MKLSLEQFFDDGEGYVNYVAKCEDKDISAFGSASTAELWLKTGENHPKVLHDLNWLALVTAMARASVAVDLLRDKPEEAWTVLTDLSTPEKTETHIPPAAKQETKKAPRSISPNSNVEGRYDQMNKQRIREWASSGNLMDFVLKVMKQNWNVENLDDLHDKALSQLYWTVKKVYERQGGVQ